MTYETSKDNFHLMGKFKSRTIKCEDSLVIEVSGVPTPNTFKSTSVTEGQSAPERTEGNNL